MDPETFINIDVNQLSTTCRILLVFPVHSGCQNYHSRFCHFRTGSWQLFIVWGPIILAPSSAKLRCTYLHPCAEVNGIIYPHSELYCLPIRHRIDYKLLHYVYKMLNGLIPAYLTDLLITYKPRRTWGQLVNINLIPHLYLLALNRTHTSPFGDFPDFNF